ncbi:GNAT family N-acetyltransferase [Cohnella fermenti]|uniref:GNAT family N-acetyltransferase n=1 Tax=Cohnella fermenti TaxID=2565925 RepID=A0A4S4C755_9BACL|nr:GNAT family N-acetyltransferase [Cohnella fermenti]THF83769.1 GNAT family N-acetyltransferase [Cohnella fermenti]
MTIRPATPRDAEPVVRLIVRAIHDIALQLTGETSEQAAARQLEQYCQTEGNRFSYRNILVKQSEGEVAGMILCYHGSDAPSLDKPIQDRLRATLGDANAVLDVEADPDEFYIDSFAVFEDYAGRGFGTELLDAAEAWAARLGHRKLALNVDYANERAHSLYLRLGYVQNKDVTINALPFRHMVKFI